MNALSMTSLETLLRRWGAAPSVTEITKCQNAERAIRKAIDTWPGFRGQTIRVFAQGSYCNRTNVRAESDVDIAVWCGLPFFTDFAFAEGFTSQDVDLTDHPYTYAAFKNEVEAALVAQFTRSAVTRGKKAFDIHANSYRVDADAVACFEHRRYTHRDTFGVYHYDEGTQFHPDTGATVINWPQQNYDNGVLKNEATGERFKAMVRVLKNLRNAMQQDRIPAAADVASFLLESLVYNVPNPQFGNQDYTDDLKAVMAVAWNATANDEACKNWREVNERKWLFHPTQPWTRQQAHNFLFAAWSYLELG